MTPPAPSPTDPTFDKLRSEDMAAEVRVLWGEIAVCALLALLVAVYLIVG